MRIHRAFGLASIAVLGGAVVVAPAEAGSETAPAPVKVIAENAPPYSHYWRPPDVSVAAGAAVEFSNPTEVPHGIRWVSTPGANPECSAGVPVGSTEAAAATKWSGSCVFASAGTYSYYCTVHGAAMSGTITVGTPATQGAGGTTGTTLAPTPPSGTSGQPSPPTPGSLSALRLVFARHGAAVRGSLQIPSAAAGGTLTVVVQARLAGRRRQVGRLTRSYLSRGLQSWSIPLSARARRALRATGRLSLSTTVTLTAPGGAPISLTRVLSARR